MHLYCCYQFYVPIVTIHLAPAPNMERNATARNCRAPAGTSRVRPKEMSLGRFRIRVVNANVSEHTSLALTRKRPSIGSTRLCCLHTRGPPLGKKLQLELLGLAGECVYSAPNSSSPLAYSARLWDILVPE